MTKDEYISAEAQKSDLFLFLKFVNPSFYKAYIGDTDVLENDQLKVASQILSKDTKKKKLKIEFKNKQLIEVFDIMLITQQRLQLFDMATGKDVLHDYYLEKEKV